MATTPVYDFELKKAERLALSMALDLGVQLDPRVHPLDFIITLHNEITMLEGTGQTHRNMSAVKRAFQDYKLLFDILRSRKLI